MGPFRLALQYLLSVIFILQMYVMLLVVAVGFFPWALFSTRGARVAVKFYCRWVVVSARVLVGLRTEVRGEVPQGATLVAAKHQSFFDIIAIADALPQPRFVMKRELKYSPLLGQYALRIGCIPVDRSRGMQSLRDMVQMATTGPHSDGQLVIFPQGTRVAPGAQSEYKVGTGALYLQLKKPCVPVAVNVGVFWPRHGLLRKPGLAVVEFLPPIAPGLKVAPFMAELESVIETASNRLMAEAGFSAIAKE